MLSVSQISKSFGIETILDKITFNLNAGDRLALVGPNGCGKTTLLRILVGEEAPDSGTIRPTQPGLRVGYLPQGFSPGLQETIGSFLAHGEADLEELGEELTHLAEQLALSPDQPALQQRYDLTLERLAAASEQRGQAPAVLAALGLGDYPLETPVSYLSGGQKTRLALAGVLISQPNLLLLDEPTNYLDLEMLEWLEGWLASFRGAVLLVSHDRASLDQTATAILELDPLTHTARLYPGSYSDYVEKKINERERQAEAYQDQQDEIARLRQAVQHLNGLAVMKKGGKADSGDKFATGFFGNRSRRTVGRAKQIEGKIERLLNEDRLQKPGESWQMKLEFEEVSNGSRQVLSLDDVAVGYQGKPLLSGINLHLKHRARAVLVGSNGSGKTTLLRAIAGVLPPLQGKIRLGSGIRLGYMRQEQEDLDPQADALSTLRGFAAFSETEARAFLHKYLFSGDEVFTPVGQLSYGERARLSLACLVAQGCSFLLLDEPLNHLDIPSRMRFEQALAGFEGAVLAVVHDRFFIQSFATEIWEIQGGKIQQETVVVEFD